MNLRIINLDKLSSLRYQIIITLLISLIIVVYLLFQRNRLYHENKNAYAVLIKKYKEENESRKTNLITANTSGTKTNNDFTDTKDELYNRLLLFYETEKPYLDSKLKVDFIAKKWL